VYQSFIGLEVHIHLLTKTKAFCGCRAAFGDEPNTNVCPVCMGYPGVLPALNEEAMRMSAVVSKALNCAISPKTWFERKQYFYPDMPKNYQISQFASPVGVDGYIDLEFQRNKKRIRIKECHLEEDAGKMIHAGNVSLIDYNRAGTSLLEIVTEPDFEIGEEAELFLQQLRRTVRYLGVCDGNMEEGSLRCDANVSVNLRGQGLGRKVEIKNLNSSRFVKLGLNYEIVRQTEILEKGGTVKQETRLWNENRDQTESMRSKESAHDYRYFPEPDLPPFIPDKAFLASVEASLVELPAARERRFAEEYGLPEAAAAFLCEEKPLADYFEAAVAASVPAASMPSESGLPAREAAERISAWLSSDVKRIMNRDGIGFDGIATMKLTPARLAQLVLLIASGFISSKIAKQTLEAVFAEDADPADIVAAHGWEQIVDPVVVGAAVDEVCAKESRTVSEIGSAGDERARSLVAYLTGKVIAATGGRADPILARRLVEERARALMEEGRNA
jgi:aspartyl-tRNA(Asn)/glutamyl-tRNA(Gln) amidotransferase subunit B